MLSDQNVFHTKNRVRNALIATLGIVCSINSAYKLLATPLSLEWFGGFLITGLLLALTVECLHVAFWERLVILPEGIRYHHLLFTALIEWSNIDLSPTYARPDGSFEYKLTLKAPILKPGSLLSRLVKDDNQKDILSLTRFVNDWHESLLLKCIRQHTSTAANTSSAPLS